MHKALLAIESWGIIFDKSKLFFTANNTTELTFRRIDLKFDPPENHYS